MSMTIHVIAIQEKVQAFLNEIFLESAIEAEELLCLACNWYIHKDISQVTQDLEHSLLKSDRQLNDRFHSPDYYSSQEGLIELLNLATDTIAVLDEIILVLEHPFSRRFLSNELVTDVNIIPVGIRLSTMEHVWTQS